MDLYFTGSHRFYFGIQVSVTIIQHLFINQNYFR